MLETLLCRIFAGGDVDRCIDRFFQCAEETGTHIRRPDKARAGVSGDDAGSAPLGGGGGEERPMGHEPPRIRRRQEFLRSLATHGMRTP